MRRPDAMAWVVIDCANSVRLSRAKTLGILVAATLSVERMTQVCSALVCLKSLMLDFYHLSEHIHAAAVCGLGETETAKAWAVEWLRELKEVGVQPVLAAIDALMKQVRAKHKRMSLESLRQYIVQRLEMLDYPIGLAHGWDIGSGPTEAMCKNLTG